MMASFVTIPSLLVLFHIDRELHEFQVALDALLKDQIALESKIGTIAADIAQQEAAAIKLQAAIGAQDLDLKTRQTHIEKMRETLNSTKTNKEYSAILVQISADKAEVSKLEAAMLENMEKLEKDQATIVATRQQLTLQQGLLATAQGESEARAAELRGHITRLQALRRDCAAKVPTEALKQYDRLRLKYPGDAMAPVEFDDDDLDNISCGGCFMALNMEDVNQLRGRDEIRRCNACNRILYLPETLEQGKNHADKQRA